MRKKRQRLDPSLRKLPQTTRTLQEESWQALAEILRKIYNDKHSGHMLINQTLHFTYPSEKNVDNASTTVAEQETPLPMQVEVSTAPTKPPATTKHKTAKPAKRISQRQKEKEQKSATESSETNLLSFLLECFGMDTDLLFNQDGSLISEQHAAESQKELTSTKPVEEQQHVVEFLSTCNASQLGIVDWMNNYIKAISQLSYSTTISSQMILEIQDNILKHQPSTQPHWLFVAEITLDAALTQPENKSFLERCAFYTYRVYYDYNNKLYEFTTPEFQARLYWLMGRFEVVRVIIADVTRCQSRGHVNLGVRYLDKLKQHLMLHGEKCTIPLPHVQHDKTISLETVDAKLGNLLSTQKMQEAHNHYVMGHHADVVQLLAPTLAPREAADQTLSVDTNLKLTMLLAESATHIGDMNIAVRAFVKIIHERSTSSDVMDDIFPILKQLIDTRAQDLKANPELTCSKLFPAVAKLLISKRTDPDVWVLFYKVAKMMPTFDTEKALKFFDQAHKDLCSTDSTPVNLLKLIVEEDSSTAVSTTAASALACLFAIELNAIKPHTTKRALKVVQDNHPVLLSFLKVVEQQALNKNYLSKLNPLLDELLTECPQPSPHVDSRVAQVDAYIHDGIPLEATTESNHESLSHFIYYKLCLLKGRCAIDFVNRASESKETKTKAAVDVVPLFTQLLYANPCHSDAWYYLGVCYHFLLEHQSEDSSLSLRTIRCYEQALALDEKEDLYQELGNLYFIQMRRVHREPETEGNLVELGEKAVYYFTKAAELQPNEWWPLYMQGKVLEKLNRDPSKFLACYQAASIVEKKENKHVEALYKLHATRLKLLRNGYSDYELLHKFRHTAEDDNTTTSQSLDTTVVQDCMQALDECAKHSASNLWFCHKAVYQQAVQHLWNGDIMKSKTKLKELFAERKTARSFCAKIFRNPTTDTGGKYEHSIWKYTKLYIQLLADTNDIDNLEIAIYFINKENIGDDLKEIAYEKYLALVQQQPHAEIDNEKVVKRFVVLSYTLNSCHSIYETVKALEKGPKRLKAMFLATAENLLLSAYKSAFPADSALSLDAIKANLHNKFKTTRKKKQDVPGGKEQQNIETVQENSQSQSAAEHEEEDEEEEVEQSSSQTPTIMGQ